MLHSISWQQYATIILLAAVAWYVYIALRFKLVKFKAPAPGIIPAVAAAPVIGAIKPDEGTAVENGELIFTC